MNPSPVRSLLTGLTLLGVMCVQLFGVMRGYYCECTESVSRVAACEDGACHPGDKPCPGDKPSCCEEDQPAESGQKPDSSGDSHRHSEVREVFASTPAAAPVPAPAPVFVEIPPPFGVTEALCPTAPEIASVLPPEHENGSPPVPLRAARTVVLMV